MGAGVKLRRAAASLSRVARAPAISLAVLVAASAPACKRHPNGATGDGDVPAGQALYENRCALCHGKALAGGQGPGLVGIIGRPAAADPGFGAYSRALRGSGLVWERATLDRFLAAPSAAVPGTSMAVALPDPGDRGAVISYLASFGPAGGAAAASGSRDRGDPRDPRGARGPGGPRDDASAPAPPYAAVALAGPGLRQGRAAFAGYRDDGPGVQRHITVADLPAPFDTPSASKGPRVVERPSSAAGEPAELHLPAGFHLELFAHGLDNPRVIRVAPNGDILVAETDPGRVHLYRLPPGASHPEDHGAFASGLSRPFGMAFYPPGPDPQWLYIANTDSIVRFPYRNGDLVARAPAQTIVPRLTVTAAGHSTRDLVFSPDGKQLFVSIGSASNVAETMGARRPEDAARWEATHGLGASWGDEENRADVLVMSPDGQGVRTFATGIRNCVGLAMAASSRDLWCATNERDGLGDDLVPDYVSRIKDGGYYGWPWFYLGNHEDPRLAGQRPDLAGKATVPDVLLQPHSAALQLAFYEGSMFPAEYRGSLFVTLHGSWNRSPRTGYKVVRVPLSGGRASGTYEDFLTGFVVDDDSVWGRPVGVAVLKDGSLLVGEDGNGTIWRVTYGASDAGP